MSKKRKLYAGKKIQQHHDQGRSEFKSNAGAGAEDDGDDDNDEEEFEEGLLAVGTYDFCSDIADSIERAVHNEANFICVSSENRISQHFFICQIVRLTYFTHAFDEEAWPRLELVHSPEAT